MEDLKKIQEFFSKPLNENKITKEDFDKVVKILSKSKYPFTIMFIPKWDEIDIITGQDSPDEIVDDIGQRLDSADLNWGGNSGITISGDSSNYSRREYSDIFRVNGGHKDYYEESVNEGTFTDGEIAIYDDPKGDDGETKIYKRGNGYYGVNDSFDFEAKNRADLEQKLKSYGYELLAGSLDEATKDEENEFHKELDKLVHKTFGHSSDEKKKMEEGAVEIMDSYNRILDLLKKESRALNDDDSYALGLKLRAWFEKNIIKEATKEEYEALLDKEYELTSAYMKDKTDANWKKLSDIRKKGKKLEKELEDQDLNEEVDQRNADIYAYQFMQYFDKMSGVVRHNFGDDTRKEFERLVKDKFSRYTISEEMMSLDDQAKAYYLAKVKRGEIDTLPEDPKAAFLAQMTKDQIDHDKETLRRERGLEEADTNKNLKAIQIQLDQLGVKYEMDPKNKVQPFKVIYKPVNKDDDFYDKFDDIVFRYNLKGVVKTSLKETSAYIAETIKLGLMLNEELCEKGKRYIKARQAAGEKSSAYLSGRAVRVCKGQIEWPKKGKKKK
jgi:hypothetical protein